LTLFKDSFSGESFVGGTESQRGAKLCIGVKGGESKKNPLGNHNHHAIRFDIIIEGYSPRGNAVRVNFKRPDFKSMRKMINSSLKGKVKHFNNILHICSWSNSSNSPSSCSKGEFG